MSGEMVRYIRICIQHYQDDLGSRMLTKNAIDPMVPPWAREELDALLNANSELRADVERLRADNKTLLETSQKFAKTIQRLRSRGHNR